MIRIKSNGKFHNLLEDAKPIEDINSVKFAGFFVVNPNTLNLPAPMYGKGIALAPSNQDTAQMLFTVGEGMTIYTRCGKTVNGKFSWQPWYTVSLVQLGGS